MTKKDETKCLQCVELLKQVLTKSASRPRALLEAMGSSCDFTPAQNGVIVSFQNDNIKNDVKASSKQPSRVTTRRESTNNATILRPQPLAASVAQQARLKIECRPCSTQGPEGGARAFVMGPSPLSIVLCSNRLHSLGDLSDTTEMEQVLLHELVHVYDVKKLQLDLRECVNLAYSEVRAAREAECRDSWMQPYCVKQKALQATSNLFPQQAASCVSQAYQQAMQDMRPFQETKNNNVDSSGSSSER